MSIHNATRAIRASRDCTVLTSTEQLIEDLGCENEGIAAAVQSCSRAVVQCTPHERIWGKAACQYATRCIRKTGRQAGRQARR